MIMKAASLVWKVACPKPSYPVFADASSGFVKPLAFSHQAVNKTHGEP